MEARTNGMLIRHYQPMNNVLIPARRGTKYRIQRAGSAPEGIRPINCNSPFVSRIHCFIYHEDNAFWLVDDGSANGTYINGVRVTRGRARELRFGDMIGLGVSHEDTVDVTTDQYFVFLFDREIPRQENADTEVIDLEDEPDEPNEPSLVPQASGVIPQASGVNSHQENAVAGRRNEREHGNEENELEIVHQTPVEDVSSKGSSSRRPKPPPPPPPIFSPSLVNRDQSLVKKQLENKASAAPKRRFSDSDGDTESSEDVETCGKSKKTATPLPRTSSTNEIPTKNESPKKTESSSSSKRASDEQDDGKCIKRAKMEKRCETPKYDSSDDSSDGLGDTNISSNQRKKLGTTNHKDFKENHRSKFGNEKKGSSGKRLSEKQKENDYNSSNNGFKHSSESENVVPVDVSSGNNEENRVRRDNMEALKAKALKSKLSITVARVIYFAKVHSKYVIRKDLNQSLTKDSRNRMERQFKQSIQKLGGSRHIKIVGSLQPEAESSSDEADEDLNKERKTSRPLSPTSSFDTDVSLAGDANSSSDDYDKRSPNTSSPKEPSPASPNEVAPSTVHKSLTAENPTPRKIVLIDDPPLPRFAARAQNKTFNFPKPQLYLQAKVVSNLSKEEKKVARTQKLKEVALNNQQEKEETASPSPEKRIQPARIKWTSRNRNQVLIETIIGSEVKTNQAEKLDNHESVAQPASSHYDDNRMDVDNEVTATSKAAPPVVVSNLNQLDAPSLQANKPESKDRNMRINHQKIQMNNHQSTTIKSHSNQSNNRGGEVNKQQNQKSSTNTSDPAPGPSRLCKGPTASQAFLKPCAREILSPPGGMDRVLYRETPGTSSSKAAATSGLEYKPLIPETDIFIRLFTWRTTWLQEQKEKSDLPPILGEGAERLALQTAVVNYQSYNDYVKAYYPLLLSEIWHVLSNDAGGRSKSGNFFNNKTSEYAVKLTHVKREGFCAFARPKDSEPSPPDKAWCTIQCESGWDKTSNCVSQKDFVILSFHGEGKDLVTSPDKPKKVFGFIIHSSNNAKPIGGNVECDPRLKPKGACGYLMQETIQCRFDKNFKIDMNQLGKIHKVSYIMPKVREFRAMNLLQSSKLFKHIVTPPKITNPWTPKYPPLEGHQMITICHSLNSEQMSMINYISNRVFSKDPELMLLHGPPGTGKTKTIVALVLQLLVAFRNQNKKGNPRILVCTPSNAAIDEIMRRLIDGIRHLPRTDRTVDLLRVGETYNKELERYTVSYRSREKVEANSSTKTLEAEREALNLEIEEKQKAIARMKKDLTHCLIQLEVLLNGKRDLEGKHESVLQDLKQSMIKGNLITKDKAEVIRNANIICTTLSSSNNSLMRNSFGKHLTNEKNPFLCCVVDEASQTTEPETLLPVALEVDKLILVGDPQQLGATVLSPEAEKKNYGQSLFTRLYHYYNRVEYGLPSPVMMLQRQYRMADEIVHFPNRYSYGGNLTSHYKKPDGYPLRPYYFLNLSSSQECASTTGQIENPDEVELVKIVLDAIQQILLNLKKQWTVGVITPYSKQKDSIRKALINKTYTEFKDILVDTVDGFQGQEKDIIILSCVRTDATGFLKSANRLNVALTRAKHSLYIIGDIVCLSQDSMWKTLIKDAAKRNHKYDVKSDFRKNLKIISTVLITKLKVA